MTVMGSQACALFSPLTLPYRADVDCYGRLENIQKDANTIAIETAMQMSIEQFSEACCFGETITVDGKQIVGRGCFVQADVYDRFSKPVVKGTDSCWLHDHANAFDLETIGCQLVKDLNAEPDTEENETIEHLFDRIRNAQKERYHLIYRHPKMSGVTFYCDGSFTNLSVEERRLFGYSLRDFQIALAKAGLPAFPKEDVKRAKQTTYLQGILRSEIRELMNSCRIDQECVQIAGGEPMLLEVLLHSHIYLRWMETFGASLFNQYLPHFNKGGLLDKVEALFYLQWSFSYANRIFIPTICGTQYPEHEISSTIAAYISKLAEKRIRESLQ